MYDKMAQVFDNGVTTCQDAEDFLCEGTVPKELRAGTSLDAVKSSYGGVEGTLNKCEGASVGTFLYGTISRTTSVKNGVNNLIDTMQTIITAMNSTILEIANATSLCSPINDTLITLSNYSSVIKYELNQVHSQGSFEGHIANASDIPIVTTTKLAIPTGVETGLETANDNMKSARASLQPTIQTDLNVNTRESTNKQLGNITTTLLDIGKQLLDNVDSLVDMEDTIDDYKTQATSTETFGQYAMAAIYSISVICLLIMFVGYLIKKRCPMCCGAYMVFVFFFWLAFVLGLFILLSMVIYDVCGCEGDYTTEGCKTMLELIKTNLQGQNFTLQGTKVELAPAIVSIVSCPVRSNSTHSYLYSPTSNFVDILGVQSVFNFTNQTIQVANKLSDSKQYLNQSHRISTAIIETRNAEANMAQAAVGMYYNFTRDGIQYNYVAGQLANPTTAPTYYPTPQPVPVQADNLRRLAYLSVVNDQMKSERDLLNTYLTEFNGTADRVVAACVSIEASLNNSEDSIDNATARLHVLSNYILTINQYTPCGFVGTAYENVVVGDFCENLFSIFDGVIPGAIICMVCMLLGFFIISMMRDCVLMDSPGYVGAMQPGEAGIELVSPAAGAATSVGGGGVLDPKLGPPQTPNTIGAPATPLGAVIQKREMVAISPVGETTKDGRAPL
uniref:Uncharacterized protein n=2 Tax=Lotharella globosa TaxID=91324 RepID=A0A7S3YXY1_9EUKA